MIINGFLVMRLPQMNYHLPGIPVEALANGVYYAGIDRQSWGDVFDEDFYTKKAPADIVRMGHLLEASNRDFAGIDVCRDVEVASKLFDYSNRRSIVNELIAVRSPSLNAIKGTFETDSQVEWIGFDFVVLGEGSLILDGLFAHPEHYSDWLSRINRYGLFDDASLLAEYTLAYQQAVELGRSEPLARPSAGFKNIAIEIGKLRLK